MTVDRARNDPPAALPPNTAARPAPKCPRCGARRTLHAKWDICPPCVIAEGWDVGGFAVTDADQPLNVDAIRARVDAATPGPWTAITNNGRKDGIGVVGQLAKRGTGEAIAVFAGVGGNRHADATFTAHAREDVPALLAEIERLRCEAEEREERA